MTSLKKPKQTLDFFLSTIGLSFITKFAFKRKYEKHLLALPDDSNRDYGVFPLLCPRIWAYKYAPTSSLLPQD